MKKNLIYLIVLVLAAGAVFFIVRQKKAETVVASDQDFAVQNIAQVERIVITDSKGKADLRRTNGSWTINDRHKAMQPKVDVLLETLQKIRVEYPVAKAATPNVQKELAAKSTKVELYRNGESSPFKTYYVGGATADSKGTYMRMESNGIPAEKIYVMGIHGFTGLLNVRYFTDETEWRDTGIFDYAMDDLAEVSVQYPQQPQFSFTLKAVNADSFAIIPTVSQESFSSKKIYKEGVAKYLSSFTYLNAEAYDNENEKKDSIVASTPFASIKVTPRAGDPKTMTLYYMPLNRRSKTQFDTKGERLPYDLDKYYAVINDGKDFVIVQDFVFGKILRKYSDFFVEPKPA